MISDVGAEALARALSGHVDAVTEQDLEIGGMSARPRASREHLKSLDLGQVSAPVCQTQRRPLTRRQFVVLHRGAVEDASSVAAEDVRELPLFAVSLGMQEAARLLLATDHTGTRDPNRWWCLFLFRRLFLWLGCTRSHS